MQKRAVFLDRDGVINVNRGYVHDVENLNLLMAFLKWRVRLTTVVIDL